MNKRLAREWIEYPELTLQARAWFLLTGVAFAVAAGALAFFWLA